MRPCCIDHRHADSVAYRRRRAFGRPEAALGDVGRAAQHNSEFQLGDRVRSHAGDAGTVVGIIERGEYQRPELCGFAELSRGVIVELDCGRLSHYRHGKGLLTRVGR